MLVVVWHAGQVLSSSNSIQGQLRGPLESYWELLRLALSLFTIPERLCLLNKALGRLSLLLFFFPSVSYTCNPWDGCRREKRVEWLDSEKILVKRRTEKEKKCRQHTHTSWAMPIRGDREDREVYIQSIAVRWWVTRATRYTVYAFRV